MFRNTALAALAFSGTASMGHAAMTIVDSGATAPTTSIFVSSTNNNSNTRVRSTDLGDLDRGQTFLAPDTGDTNTQWGLTAITIQLRDIESLSATPVMNLQIVNWGIDAQALDPGSVIYNESAAFVTGLDNEDFFTFNLGTTVALNENTNYGFLMSFDSSGDSIRPRVSQNASATYTEGSLWGGTAMTTSQDMTFYLTGAVIAVPEPGSALLGGLGLLALLRRRRA